jgi:hypothetical protein
MQLGLLYKTVNLFSQFNKVAKSGRVLYQKENAKHAKNGVFILSVDGSQSRFPIERLHAFFSVPCLLGYSSTVEIYY